MRARLLFFILIILNLTLVTGCWNYREINKLTIVAGVAIDKTEAGKFDFTFEIVDLHEGGRDVKVQSKLIETQGDTIFDAVRNAIKVTPTKLYFGHMEIVIISQEIAREGVLEILDILSRDNETRLTTDLLVSKEKTAKEILFSQSYTTEIRSYEINDMLDAQKGLNKSLKTEVYQFIDELPCDGISPILPAVQLTESAGIKTSQLSGNAIFYQDKLLGFLAEEETKYLSFIKNKVKGGLLVLKDCPVENNVYISLEIFDSKTVIRPVYLNGKLAMNIAVKTRVALGEQGTRRDFISENCRAELEKNIGEFLKGNITMVIKEVQKEFGVDIFGFGRIVNRNMPDVWDAVQSDWTTIFQDLEVNVDTKVEIRDSGLLSRPIKVGS